MDCLDERQGSKKTIFMDKAPGMWPMKMDKPRFFSDKPENKTFFLNLLISRGYIMLILLVNKL